MKGVRLTDGCIRHAPRRPHLLGSRRVVERAIQFKYGDTWQHTYDVGDPLRWGGNDIGEPGQKHVVVDAIAEDPCPNCGYGDEWSLYLHIENDRITRIETATDEYDFVKEGRTYVLLQE
jgi:hypothetical protein